MYHLFFAILITSTLCHLHGKTNDSSMSPKAPIARELENHEDLLEIGKQPVNEESDSNGSSNEPFQVLVDEKREIPSDGIAVEDTSNEVNNQPTPTEPEPEKKINKSAPKKKKKKKSKKKKLSLTIPKTKQMQAAQSQIIPEQINTHHWKKYPQWASSTMNQRQYEKIEENESLASNSSDQKNQESTLRLFRPQQWAIGGHVGINDILAPVELKADSSFGPMIGLWLRYHWNSFSGIETGIQQLDFSDTRYGITEYYSSLLFQTGWWEDYHPFFIVGPSLFKQEQSATASEKWRPGINLSAGIHFGSGLNLERFYWIPALHFKTIFSSGSEKQVSTLGISLGIAFYFDDADIDTSVFSLR